MRTAVALTVLILLAGCSGLSGGPAATPSAGVTGTEPSADGSSVDVATDAGGEPTDAAGPPEYPPGVTAEGVTNASALLDAHWTALRNEGYVVERWENTTTRRERVPENLTRREYERYEVAAGGTTVFHDRRSAPVARPRVGQSTWDNGTIRVERHHERGWPPDRTDFVIEATGGNESAPAQVRGWPASLPEADAWTRTAVHGTGADTVVRIWAERTWPDGSKFTGTAIVEADGLIRRLSTTRTDHGDERSSTDRVTIRLREVGVDRVERPPWFERALESVPRFEVNATIVDDRYVEVRNVGPDPIPADAAVEGVLLPCPNSASVELTRAVQPGTAVYLTRPGPDRLVAHRTEPGANATFAVPDRYSSLEVSLSSPADGGPERARTTVDLNEARPAGSGTLLAAGGTATVGGC